MTFPRLAILFVIGLVLFVWGFRSGGLPEVSARDISPDHDVVLFTTTWCGYCEQSRRWLRRNDIAFIEFDIDASDANRSRFEELNGRGVPLAYFGNQRVQGFSADLYRDAVDRL